MPTFVQNIILVLRNDIVKNGKISLIIDILCGWLNVTHAN